LSKNQWEAIHNIEKNIGMHLIYWNFMLCGNRITIFSYISTLLGFLPLNIPLLQVLLWQKNIKYSWLALTSTI